MTIKLTGEMQKKYNNDVKYGRMVWEEKGRIKFEVYAFCIKNV